MSPAVPLAVAAAHRCRREPKPGKHPSSASPTPTTCRSARTTLSASPQALEKKKKTRRCSAVNSNPLPSSPHPPPLISPTRMK
ncbi:hypothetical protein M0R45_008859 [Rubus argutus]|uniref:Uncharacterized protein n=1 Tax=Rubus argutus TaxID=59490 RepID=A0AAW1Y5B1_RUBAR